MFRLFTTLTGLKLSDVDLHEKDKEDKDEEQEESPDKKQERAEKEVCFIHKHKHEQ